MVLAGSTVVNWRRDRFVMRLGAMTGEIGTGSGAMVEDLRGVRTPHLGPVAAPRDIADGHDAS
jgi:hypothetical protein